VKYAWIAAHIDSYPVRLMCELLVVSPSGFYAAQSRAPSARAVEQVLIVTEIRRAQTRHRGRYGRRRMTTSDASCASMICAAVNGAGSGW